MCIFVMRGRESVCVFSFFFFFFFFFLFFVFFGDRNSDSARSVWHKKLTWWHDDFFPLKAPIDFILFNPVAQIVYLCKQRRSRISRLIRIYTVCHSVFDFWMAAPFATMDVSKFKRRRVHFKNSGAKGLNSSSPFIVTVLLLEYIHSDSR